MFTHLLVPRYRTASIVWFAALLLLSACAQITPLPSTSSRSVATSISAVQAVFTVQGEGGRAVVRALSAAGQCPFIQWDGAAPRKMAVRAEPAVVPVRGGAAQPDSKEAVFPVLTCEAEVPSGVQQARIEGVNLPVPRPEIRRIVVIADTGCRMKQSEDAFQPCNDADKWPFAQIAAQAAALKPDLVIHLGDLHYRESPCPAGNAGCANSPWGYGYDAWNADLFQPARPLLAAAPWVFVRGNHETCARAGQGWFRFVDAMPWSEARSCNDRKNDANSDFSNPYTVPLSDRDQLIVFDSSRTGSKPYTPQDEAYQRYALQVQQVALQAQLRAHSMFLSHHPVLGFAKSKVAGQVGSGSMALQSVMHDVQGEGLFPAQISAALHGHTHLFESVSFSSAHPVALVLGNSGSANEGGLPKSLPAGSSPAPGAVVEDFSTRSGFGFATLDRQKSGWTLMEWNVQGQAMIRCQLQERKSRCETLVTE